MMNRIVSCLLVVLLCAGALHAQSTTAPLTTMILVRHAEKATTPKSDDPELSQLGGQRAEKLAQLLSQIPLVAAYSTPYKRTISTALPAAKAHNLSIQEYAAKPSTAFLDTLIQKHVGGTVLVVGHSNTIPQLVNMLVGKEAYKQFDDADYDNVFIVTLSKRGNASVTHLTLKM